jgi:lysophospholipase L1-like esterase
MTMPLRRARVFLVLALCLAMALFVNAAARADEGNATTYYVSLGDSLSVGVQPIGPPPFFETNQGYTDQLYATLRETEPKLRHVRLGCGGESTTSMQFGSQDPDVASSCGPPVVYQKRYPHKTQLAEAVSFLSAHKGKVELVTIDIGANDVLGMGGVGAIVANLPVILAELRAAAGPEVPIVGMNYYGGFFPDVWFATHSIPALQSQVAGLLAFNDLLEGFYAAAGMPVADVESAFSSTNLTLVGGVPLNVLRICQWTWECEPPPLGPNIHLNATGYGVVASAFLAAIPT